MLFKNKTLSEIKNGEITAAIRKWKKPTVKTGGTLHTPVGLLLIESVEKKDFSSLLEEDFKKAGFSDPEDCKLLIDKIEEGEIYLIHFHLIGPDPRLVLGNSEVSEIEFQDIMQKLSGMDKRSRFGAWTYEVLKIIDTSPGLKAQEIASQMKVDKDWLKTNIRKLKNLGLTISLETGYKISMRGKSFIFKMNS